MLVAILQTGNMDMGPVTLVVKAPNHRIEDKTIAGDMGWTVRKLKEHISSIYPERPVSSN